MATPTFPIHPHESFSPVPVVPVVPPPPLPPPVVTTSVGHFFEPYGAPAVPLAILFLAALAFDVMLRKYPPSYKRVHHPPPIPPFAIPPEFLANRHRRHRRRNRHSTTAAPAHAPPPTLDPNLAHFQVNTPLGSLHVSSNAHKDKHKLFNKLFSKKQGLVDNGEGGSSLPQKSAKSPAKTPAKSAAKSPATLSTKNSSTSAPVSAPKNKKNYKRPPSKTTPSPSNSSEEENDE